MARDSQGNFNLPSPMNPVQTNTVIESIWANTTLADVAAGLSDSLSRTGKGGMGAPLDMGGYRIVALSAALFGTDAPQAIQQRDSVFNRLFPCTSDATGQRYDGVAVINAPAVDGTVFLFVADKKNGGNGSMSLAVNGAAALPILMNGGAIPPGIIEAGAVIGVMFINGTWRLTNTAGIVGTVNSVQSDNTPAISVTNDFLNAVATLNIHTNLANGLVQLDSNAKVPITQMPFTALHYIGQWNAQPGINPVAAANGDFYLISGAGTLPLFRVQTGNGYTSQATPVVIGDQIVYNTAGTALQPVGWYYSPAPGTTVTAANVSVTPTPSFPAANSAQLWFAAADPAIAGKLSLIGGTLTGQVHQTNTNWAADSLVTKTYVDGVFQGIPLNVSSFNMRTGVVVLSDTDVLNALQYTPANAAGQVFSGPINAPAINSAGFHTGIGFSQYNVIPQALTAIIDYASGQSQIRNLTAPITVTNVNNIPVGSILRLTLTGTTNAITWPAAVNWPLGTAPNLALGPLKKAIVVFENDGGVILATSAAF